MHFHSVILSAFIIIVCFVVIFTKCGNSFVGKFACHAVSKLITSENLFVGRTTRCFYGTLAAIELWENVGVSGTVWEILSETV